MGHRDPDLNPQTQDHTRGIAVIGPRSIGPPEILGLNLSTTPWHWSIVPSAVRSQREKWHHRGCLLWNWSWKKVLPTEVTVVHLRPWASLPPFHLVPGHLRSGLAVGNFGKFGGFPWSLDLITSVSQGLQNVALPRRSVSPESDDELSQAEGTPRSL